MATSLKLIDAEIATFTTDRNKLRDHAQQIGLMIFRHAAPKAVSEDCSGTGDCTRAIKLVEALPTSWGEQMIAWFHSFTPIRVSLKNKKCEYAKEYKDLSPAEKKEQVLAWWKLTLATETPFHEASEERAIREYDDNAIVEMVRRLAKTIEKKAKDGKVKNVAFADSVVAILSALKFEPVAAANSNDEGSESFDQDLKASTAAEDTIVVVPEEETPNQEEKVAA